MLRDFGAFNDMTVDELEVAGDQLYFFGSSALWTSDGTSGGDGRNSDFAR